MAIKKFSPAELELIRDLELSSAHVAGKTERSIRAIDTKRYELRKTGRLAGATKPALTAEQHAKTRADGLRAGINDLITSSRYPVVNPEAILVESYLINRYLRKKQGMDIREGTPRTWISDTLRVAPIADAKGRKFLFTGAQNDAPIHAPFWKNLNAYAKQTGAEIVVGPWTYETQWWSENNPTARTYATELSPHLCFGQFRIGSNFMFCGEMNTLPTANRPISDLVTYSRGKWAVFPHARLQLKSVPTTDPTVQAHQVMTTGAVTRPKVIARKAGVRSIFHHVIGATLVEFGDGPNPFCRQINATDDGDFYDLDARVSKGKVTFGHRARAIVFGDIHTAKLNAKNLDGSISLPDSLLNVLKPEYVMVHDLHDQEIGNHHRVGDCGHAYELAVRERYTIAGELDRAQDVLDRLKRTGCQVVVVESNHDLALERYVREGRYRGHGKNMMLGLKLDTAYTAWRGEVANALDFGGKVPDFSMLEFALRSRDLDRLKHVQWAYDGKSFKIDGIEVGHHGFRGANGARGTVSGFSNMGTRISIGDKHSPEIMDGVYVAGTMELQHGYNKGPSGWAVAHIIHYPNGKRSLVTLQDGKWRA
jgi:hypothetical protein